MESRKHLAIEKHNLGYNCAQSVALTYEDLTDISPEHLFKLTEGFGLGGGNMQGTCGAVSGAIALTGLLNSCGDLEHPSTKAQTYAMTREILDKFKEQNGSVLCHELKGAGTGKVLRSCPDCIMDACELFESLYEAKLKK
ncbi:MAG: C-GCAxxG-C-C family protein [Anaerovibrio sp.]|nr:C-GCAxxG-C-C family protein [Anaerovibrio sp.]